MRGIREKLLFSCHSREACPREDGELESITYFKILDSNFRGNNKTVTCTTTIYAIVLFYGSNYYATINYYEI